MININDLKLRVHDLVNTHQTGAGLKPDLFNRLINPAIYYVLRRYIGLPEEYQPEQPLPSIAYEITQSVTNALQDIKAATPIILTNGSGAIPPDYFYPIVLYYTTDIDTVKERFAKYEQLNCHAEDTQQIPPPSKQPAKPSNTYPIDIVTTKERIYAEASAIRRPTKRNPIASFDFPNIQVSPSTISKAQFMYLRKPKKALWNYTIVNAEAVYNPIGSQDIELPIELTDNIVAKVMADLGYRVRETELQNIADKIIKTGS